MLDKLIAPIVVGIVVGFALLFGPDVKHFLLPEYEVLYKVNSSKRLLGPEDIGRKEISILDKKVSDVFITQVNLKNTGKKSVKDVEILIDIKNSKTPELYRVFYTTKPAEMFGEVEFSNFKNQLSKTVKIKDFIENNEITVSLISSELLNINLIANKADVRFKEYTEKETIEEHAYVALMSALSVILGRLLIDFFVFLIALYRGTQNQKS